MPSFGFKPVCPSIIIFPELGDLSNINKSKKVDLPEPEVPDMPKISPLFNLNDKFSMIWLLLFLYLNFTF